jgi:hypothetical protein
MVFKIYHYLPSYLCFIVRDLTPVRPIGLYPSYIDEWISITKNFQISQNYPKPCNTNTKISFSLPNTEKVLLKVYKSLGGEIEILTNEILSPGKYTIEWDAKNLSSGIYFCKLTSGLSVKQ